MTPTEAAVIAARAGAEVLMHHWQSLGRDDADLKSRNDWVSRADRESEAAIIRSLGDSYPDDAFFCEEGGDVGAKNASHLKAKRTWVIDPLDGTSNYLQHFPFWSVSIGLRDGDEMVAGVILEPLRDLVFTVEKGAGAFRNGERIHVSEQRELEGSFLATGFPFRAQKYVGTYCSIFQDVIRVSRGVRRAGSAALDLAYTAAGVFDGFFEMHLAPWDVAAGALMIREAGGVVTDFSGGDSFWKRGNIVGAPPEIHAALLELIATHTCEADLG
ncbi:MAG TPA: inositol monophosphatase family protein [Thermoanaerobaculia bacterium]|nr:inositol monophosphatase family protein [Thermoanaerobaculia bacterium]